MRCVRSEDADLSQLSLLPSPLCHGPDFANVGMGTTATELSSLTCEVINALPTVTTTCTAPLEVDAAPEDASAANDAALTAVTSRERERHNPQADDAEGSLPLNVDDTEGSLPLNVDNAEGSLSLNSDDAEGPLSLNVGDAEGSLSLNVGDAEGFRSLNVDAARSCSSSGSDTQLCSPSSLSPLNASQSESESSHVSVVRKAFCAGRSHSTTNNKLVSSAALCDIAANKSGSVVDDAVDEVTADEATLLAQDRASPGFSRLPFPKGGAENGNDNRTKRLQAKSSKPAVPTVIPLSDHPPLQVPVGPGTTGRTQACPAAQLQTVPETEKPDTDPEHNAHITLPERYHQALRRSGSCGSLCSYGTDGAGCGSSHQDLTSRERDLGTALAWIRHEMVSSRKSVSAGCRSH